MGLRFHVHSTSLAQLQVTVVEVDVVARLARKKHQGLRGSGALGAWFAGLSVCLRVDLELLPKKLARFLPQCAFLTPIPETPKAYESVIATTTYP